MLFSCQDHHTRLQRLSRTFRLSVRRTVTAIIVSVVPLSAAAGGSRLIEVSDGTQTHQGQVIAMDNRTCCFIDRMGRMERLKVTDLKSFRVVAEQFRAGSVADFRDSLLREFGSRYELNTTSHYVLCAPRHKAAAYAGVFEDVYRVVDQFFRVRGFQVKSPDTPLVAVVFGSQKEFAEYCARDAVAWSEGLKGYYSLKTNRVALFDDPTLLQASRASSPAHERADQDAETRLAAFSAVGGETANTIIHETTHQVSYNIGVHSRAGGTPLWIVEGLATVLEAPGMRQRKSHGSVAGRLNDERFQWFTHQYAERRASGDLGRMVASDEMFGRQTLDAYSNAWAFTFFASESPARTQQFVRYLQSISARDPMKLYTAEERLKDFSDAFGDIARLEVEFNRSMDRMN